MAYLIFLQYRGREHKEFKTLPDFGAVENYLAERGKKLAAFVVTRKGSPNTRMSWRRI